MLLSIQKKKATIFKSIIVEISLAGFTCTKALPYLFDKLIVKHCAQCKEIQSNLGVYNFWELIIPISYS